jgi:fructose-bisphosphate aldolase class I
MHREVSSAIAALLTPGKGILAADESLPTIGARFEEAGIVSTAENRRAYRELLFTTSELGTYISGAILFDETMNQQSERGVRLPDVLAAQGIAVGIKVDRGTVPLTAFPGEMTTEGLDGLRGRLAVYREQGACFTKWRAAIRIGEAGPSRACVAANASALAVFAALSQEAGLAPIVEPEVLMDGTHTIAVCEDVMTSTLRTIVAALCEHRVVLEHMLLKTAMVVSGDACPEQAGDEVVAESTRRCLRRVVPAAVPGVVFLSGGQGDIDATRRLNAICGAGPAPWTLSFSFGRALQAAALAAWKGVADNRLAAQQKLIHRARCNSAAIQGAYSADIEGATRP